MDLGSPHININVFRSTSCPERSLTLVPPRSIQYSPMLATFSACYVAGITPFSQVQRPQSSHPHYRKQDLLPLPQEYQLRIPPS